MAGYTHVRRRRRLTPLPHSIDGAKDALPCQPASKLSSNSLQLLCNDLICNQLTYVLKTCLQVAAGIPSDKVLVGGFSQGGAVALTMLRSPLKLAGVLGLSCYLLMHHDRPLVSEANKSTPVLM